MKIAVMGCGTVGAGVVDIIEKHANSLAAKCAADALEVKYILDIRDLSNTPYGAKQTKNLDDILNDKEVGVVVETMGGTEPAFTFCMKALAAGKSVVTSNKALVAAKAPQLFEEAKKNNAAFMFEAAVGGGIPVIRTMLQSLSSNEISGFAGILNGTTNFILTKMISDKMSFEGALELAQEYGYAEKDPTADVDGLDACRKACILSSIAFGKHIYPEEIKTEGIRGITLEDVAYVNDFGGKIKLLARAEKSADGKIYAIVSPAVVKNSSMLAGVEGVFNAVIIRGDSVGDIMLYGAGAGKMPTAAAVTADVLECIRLQKNESIYCWQNGTGKEISDYDDITAQIYVRGFSKNPEQAIISARETFGKITLLSRENAPESEIAFVTDAGVIHKLFEAVKDIKGFVPASIIRITDY